MSWWRRLPKNGLWRSAETLLQEWLSWSKRTATSESSAVGLEEESYEGDPNPNCTRASPANLCPPGSKTHAALSEQKMCATQAKKFFNETAYSGQLENTR